MIYQFEHDEITNCGDYPCCDTISGCQLGKLEEGFDKIPADCPLVAISKTETTSCESKREDSDPPCSECRLYQRFVLGEGID